MVEIACFISPHGFGHATRVIAVVEALQQIRPSVHAHFFTTVPSSLFTQTLTSFTRHPVEVDVGLVQSSALDCDIAATIRRLDKLQPYPRHLIEKLAALCAGCSLVLCDIAPLGIVVARAAGLPSILVENFTWDWIYRPYVKKHPRLAAHARFLHKLFNQADYRIQTEPLCDPVPSDLHCKPIFRRIQKGAYALKKQIDCPRQKLVVVTMGGVFQQLPSLRDTADFPDIYFLFTGQKETKQLGENMALLARDSPVYHPDLLNAADVVVCKAGYSTVAECCQAGARVISVGRADFPESVILQKYIRERLGGTAIGPKRYENGEWVPLAAALLAGPKPAAASENGAARVADFMTQFI